MAVKPATPRGVMGYSAPPAIMMSASPRWMMRVESPMAWVPVAQAVQLARLGPLKPNLMDTWPAARLAIQAGRKNGDIRSGPFCISISLLVSMVWMPPMPEPM